MELNKIYHENCLDTMARMAAGDIPLIITSPPYNLKNSTGNGLSRGKTNSGKWRNAKLKDGYDTHSDNMPHEEYVKWQRKCLSEMFRIIPEYGAIFYNHKWRVQGGVLQDRSDILDGFPVRQVIIWNRKSGFNFNDSYFVPTYEVIYLIAKPKFRLAKGANSFGDVWEFKQEQNNAHPAPFPVHLPDRIIKATKPDFVYDPFSGSGTTAIACINNGVPYLGSEISEEYVLKSIRRIELNKNLFSHVEHTAASGHLF